MQICGGFCCRRRRGCLISLIFSWNFYATVREKEEEDYELNNPFGLYIFISNHMIFLVQFEINKHS